jgi:phosphoribosylanthranilate isomerase
MEKVRVKICGIRTLDEAECAVEAGAVMLGFNFWPASPRYIKPGAAKLIIDKLPGGVSSIGVFVNESAEKIIDINRETGLSAIQLHGDESPAECKNLSGLSVIKAMRVGEGFRVERICEYGVDTVLLDASLKGRYGGTGVTFDWSIAARARAYAKIILAGGLNAENVKEAIQIARPFAVDVCSGVEAAPGRKDFAKMREFISIVTKLKEVSSGGAYEQG